MNTKYANIVITASAVLLLVLGVVVIKTVSSVSSALESVASAIQGGKTQRFGGTTNYGGSLTVEDLTTTANSVTGTTGSITTVATTTSASSGVPSYYTNGGYDYADVQQSFTTATNTPVFIKNPFGTATTTFKDIYVQVTGGGPAMEFDIATTSGSNFATTTAVLVKDISVALNKTYDGFFNLISVTQATSTPFAYGIGVTTGTLPGVTTAGESLWFLSPTDGGIMLKIASTTVAQSYTGTVSVTFKKP